MDDEEHIGLGSSTKGLLRSSSSGGPSGAAPVWKSGGTLFPSQGGTHYETETGGGGRQQRGSASSWVAGIPRAARAAGNKGAGPRGPPQPTKLQPDNVGFRLLQKAGWNVGEGLGKSGDGILEPLTVYKKSDRRGVGGSSTSKRVAVGEEDDRGGDKATNQKKNIAGGAKGDGGGGGEDDDAPPQLVMSKHQMSEYVRKTARDRHIAWSIYRAFKEEEPQADSNPLLRRRKEQEEAELGAKRNKRKRERGGGDGGADGMSANNPLRGLW